MHTDTQAESRVENKCSANIGALTPFGRGVARVFHKLLVELRLLLVAEVEERGEEGQEESWEVESGEDQGEEIAHMDDMWMKCGQGSNLSQCGRG